MTPAKCVLLVFWLLPLWAQGRDVYEIHDLSEREVLQMYTSLLVDGCRHANRFWKTSTFDPAAGHWGSGISDGNEGIRAIGGMVFGCATLLKYSDGFNASEREEYLRKVTAAIRYAVATHVTGTQKCTDGKRWGNSWQSAMWTGTIGFGAWLLWDELDENLRKATERVIGFEADRFLTGDPPGNQWLDTKAEENGWNLICISIAANMFPDHPHAGKWREKAIEYMMNTLSAPQDLQEGAKVDGRRVRDWVKAANVHPDFTLENHGFFHPSYVACSSYFLTQAAMQFTYARRPIPRAATHHLMDTWRMFQTLILPCGESVYPQGMDWELHGLPYLNLFASLAAWQRDPLAARMEQLELQYMRGWQKMCDGDLAVPGSRLGLTRHAICVEQAAYGYLAHKVFGPPAKELTAQKAAARVRGVQQHESVGLITHRTSEKFFSVSWKNKVMSILIPIGPGHEGNPDFTVPLANGLVGSFQLEDAKNVGTRVLQHSWKKTADGFETTAALATGDLLRQTIKISSIGEKVVVYQDQVVALSDVTVVKELGVPLGIENDEITGGKRVVRHRDGEIEFDWRKPRETTALPGSWVNIDGRLGVVAIEGAGISYAQATEYSRGISVHTDVLYASNSERMRHFRAGEIVARRVVVLAVEVSPEQTQALAESARVEEQRGKKVLSFKVPGGGNVSVKFDAGS